MTTLRVRVPARWDPARAQSWALYDAQDGLRDEGRTASDAWPAHDRLEIVLGAPGVRVVAVALPPLPAARVAAAARFAVEDQIAGDAASSTHLAVSRQERDGIVRVVITPRDAMRSLRPSRGASGKLRRVIAEPELALPTADWRWCRGDEPDSGFLCLPDGTALPVSDVGEHDDLPAELTLALQRATAPPAHVRVDWPASADDRARWQEATGIAFVAGSPWRWQAVPHAAFAGATNLLQGELGSEPSLPASSAKRIVTPALWLLGLAVAIHVVATLTEWASLRVARWQAAKQWESLGVAAGLPRESVSGPNDARIALARRRTELLHAHRALAPDDALPLLARASRAFRGLPPGSVRRAIYADGHWTIELSGNDPGAWPALDRALRQADLDALSVPVPGGLRVRFGAIR